MKSLLRRFRRDLYFLRQRYWPRRIKVNKRRFGSDYGGWVIATDNINSTSIVYSFGIGTDVTFDVALIDEYGLEVCGFDPTPKSIRWVKEQALPKQFRFFEWGLADFDGMLKVFEPENPDYVSHTAVNPKNTNAIEFPVKTFSTTVGQLGHKHVDVLKMDIEGSEYGVLEDLVQGALRPSQLLVEFHHTVLDMGWEKTETTMEKLASVGYQLFHVSDSGHEFSFLHSESPSSS